MERQAAAAEAFVTHGSTRRRQRIDAPQLVLTALVLALAALLKLHFSRAAAVDLLWILEPTQALVELVTRREFNFEPAGFVNTELGLVIAPACAGVNFMIMALLTLALGEPRFHAPVVERVLGFIWIVPVAFLVTVVVNATRIILIARLGGDHRVLGVVLYATALAVLHLGHRAVLGAHRARAPALAELLLPLAVYVSVALLVPLLNGAWQNSNFASHAVTVLLVSVSSVACVAFLRERLRPAPRTGSGHTSPAFDSGHHDALQPGASLLPAHCERDFGDGA